MTNALVTIPPIKDSELLRRVINYLVGNLTRAGFTDITLCGPLSDIDNVDLGSIVTYINYHYSSSKGLLGECIDTQLTPPVILIRGTQPYLNYTTYIKLLWALTSFSRPIVVPSRGGRGLSTPILMSSPRLLKEIVKLNRRLKLASAMVKFLIEHKRDVLLVEVKDECAGIRISSSSCLGRLVNINPS